jgi:mono/diheme cytochrome c family protein
MKVRFMMLLSILFLIACKTQYKPRPKYDFPPAMAANIRENFAKICDQGAILYDKNCARCHNSKVKGKMVIPDFTEEKLVGYTIRVANKKHEANMPDSIVSAEDLGLISTFLMYKTKNNPANK